MGKLFWSYGKVVTYNKQKYAKDNIKKLQKYLADTTEKGYLIYGFGTGHSHLVVDDAFCWAATLANYCAFAGNKVQQAVWNTKVITLKI